MGLGFRVSGVGLGFRVSGVGLGFRVSGVGNLLIPRPQILRSCE